MTLKHVKLETVTQVEFEEMQRAWKTWERIRDGIETFLTMKSRASGGWLGDRSDFLGGVGIGGIDHHRPDLMPGKRDAEGEANQPPAEDDDVGIEGPGHLDARLAVRGRSDLETLPAQERLQVHPEFGCVIDDEGTQLCVPLGVRRGVHDGDWIGVLEEFLSHRP